MLLGIVAFALVTYGVVLEFDHSIRNSLPEADRDAAIWKCATKLSGKDSMEATNSPRKIAVQEFLAGVASKVDAPDTICSWQTNFGTLYNLFILRESLSVQDQSWYPSHLLTGASDVCRWARVKCNVQKNVQGIFLNHANLTGTIPMEIVGLADSLTTLNLFTNENIIGTIPAEMGGLSNLEHLFLQETSIAGSVPSVLGSLTKLKELLLDRTNLTGTIPSEICNLRLHELESLHADCRKLHPRVHCTGSCCTTCN